MISKDEIIQEATTLANAGTVSNMPDYSRILSELKHTMISGESTFQEVVKALQAKFEGVHYG